MSTVLANTITAVGGGGSTLKMANDATYVSEGTAVTQNTVQGLVKVWVLFDGGASGAASRDSFNVSGMTDSGSGDYEVGISNAMGNSDYGGGAAGRISGNISFDDGGGNSTTSVGLGSLDASGSRADCNDCGVVIAGDLA